jgi:hypothetical protein
MDLGSTIWPFSSTLTIASTWQHPAPTPEKHDNGFSFLPAIRTTSD